MIIIEEDESDFRRTGALQGVEEEEEKLTPEEEKYRSAVALMESVDCVVRYERSVSSLRDAAALFEELGEYKDSAGRAARCIRQAEKCEKSGLRDVYQAAVRLFEEAETKQDYRDTIVELERVVPYEDSEEKITACKQAIAAIETKTVWRNRLAVLLILCVMAVIFVFVWNYLGIKDMFMGR